jgi:UDP-N-acetylglucosamine 2-epimerase (non-hydrolysing)
VSIRTSSERPEALDSGVFIIGSITDESVMQSVRLAVDLNRSGTPPSSVTAYSDDNVSLKVVKLVQSYTPIINRMVWRK